MERKPTEEIDDDPRTGAIQLLHLPHIQRMEKPIGTEVSIQEAKSMLKQVYKKMGLNVGRGVTTKELEQYVEVKRSYKHENRVIKILEFKKL